MNMILVRYELFCITSKPKQPRKSGSPTFGGAPARPLHRPCLLKPLRPRTKKSPHKLCHPILPRCDPKKISATRGNLREHLPRFDISRSEKFNLRKLVSHDANGVNTLSFSFGRAEPGWPSIKSQKAARRGATEAPMVPVMSVAQSIPRETF